MNSHFKLLINKQVKTRFLGFLCGIRFVWVLSQSQIINKMSAKIYVKKTGVFFMIPHEVVNSVNSTFNSFGWLQTQLGSEQSSTILYRTIKATKHLSLSIELINYNGRMLFPLFANILRAC